MLITRDMTLDFLFRKSMISTDLYKFMKTYKVKSLGEAMSYLDCGLMSKNQRKELEKLQHEIEEKISLFNELSLVELYLKGLISTRLFHCLQDLGFTSFYQISQFIDSNAENYDIFLEQRNFGRKSLMEIRDIFSFLKQSDSNRSERETVLPTIVTMQPALKCDVEGNFLITSSTTIDSLHKDKLISVRTYNCLKYAGLATIDDILDYINAKGTIEGLLSIRNFGRKSLTELQMLLAFVSEDTEKKPLPSCIAIEPNSNIADDFIINYNELIKNEIYKLSIEYYYKTNKAKLSARSIHALDENFSSIQEVASLYFTGLDITDLRYCGEKTYDELKLFIISLYHYISSLFVEDSDNVELLLLKNTYPFLSESEVNFVMDYKMKTSNLPMFYILYHYMIKSSARSEIIFCRYYGLKGEPEDLRSISESFDVSFERCRQLLVHSKIREDSLCSSENWNHYDFLDSTLFYNDYDYKSILNNEGLGHLSLLAFVGLCSLVKNVKVCRIGRVSPKDYYVSGEFYDSFDLKNCIKDIDVTLNKRCTEDVNLPISVFIDSYWLKEPTFSTSKVEDIIIYILKEDYGIDIGADRILHLSQNSIDRSEEIYKIIEKHGKPMHVKLIREALISRYPELSDLSIEQVRGYALKHNRIDALGKSSTYTIDKWELYTGTIRDLLFDILSEEKEPMYIEELYDEISAIYPNTSIKSITSSMVSDELQRFVRFVGSYYGVSDKKYDDEFVVWDAEAYSRKTFNERIGEFETFLRSHRHLPRYDRDNEDEAALCRWYKRVTANDASISSEQQRRLSDLLARNADFLVTATEYSFYRYCEEFKAFIEDNMDFPTLETDSAKYGWFMKNKRIYKDFEDRRKTYFEDLIEFLNIYGFEF